MSAYGLTLPQVFQTLDNSNINVGGQTVIFGPQAAIVRGVGLIHTMDDLRNTNRFRSPSVTGALSISLTRVIPSISAVAS